MSDAYSNRKSKTDWDKLRAMTDDAIDTTDVPPLSREFFEKAELRLPRDLTEVTLKLDPDVLAWFKAQGEDWQRRLNAALRLYAEAHRAYPGTNETAA